MADAGDALFAARDLRTRGRPGFVCPAFYLTMGSAVPAGVGIQLALRDAQPDCRPLVLVGDGAFQMTGLELSTAARFGCNPIVIVLNNDGYTTERYHTDGAFNDLLRWNYADLPRLLGVGAGRRVHTEGELAAALAEARRRIDSFFIIDVWLDRTDASEALRDLWSNKG